MPEFTEALHLRTALGEPIVLALDPSGPAIEVRAVDGTLLVCIRPDSIELRDAGGSRAELNGDRSTLELRDDGGREKVHLNGQIGLLELRRHADLTTVRLDGRLGMVQVLDSQGRSRVRLRADDSSLVLEDDDGATRVRAAGLRGKLELGYGDMTVSADGDIGTIDLRNRHALHVPRSIGLDGRYGTIGLWNTLAQPAEKTIGMDGRYGTLVLRDGHEERIRLDGRYSQLFMQASGGGHWVDLDGRYGRLRLTGDVELANADCAEDFEVADLSIRPGEVVVIDQDGRILPCTSAYDTRVAGVVSGAGGYRPGIVLDRPYARESHRPVAMVGKVFVYADASAPIRAGDPLTTAARRGHAQLASDPIRSGGAILGKALDGLSEGTALIPMLVAPR